MDHLSTFERLYATSAKLLIQWQYWCSPKGDPRRPVPWNLLLFKVISDYSKGVLGKLPRKNPNDIIPTKYFRILVSLNIAKPSHNLFWKCSDIIPWIHLRMQDILSKSDNMSAFERLIEDHILTLQIWCCIVNITVLSRLVPD